MVPHKERHDLKLKALMVPVVALPLVFLGVPSSEAKTLVSGGCFVGKNSHIHSTISVTTDTLPGYRRVYVSQTAKYTQAILGPDVTWTAMKIKVRYLNKDGSQHTSTKYTNPSWPRAQWDLRPGGAVRAEVVWKGTKPGWPLYHGTATCITTYLAK